MTTAAHQASNRGVSPGGSELAVAQDKADRLAYSVEEAAVLLGISRTSAYLACQRGELPSRLIGRRRVVPIAALRAYLAAQDGAGAA